MDDVPVGWAPGFVKEGRGPPAEFQQKVRRTAELAFFGIHIEKNVLRLLKQYPVALFFLLKLFLHALLLGDVHHHAINGAVRILIAGKCAAQQQGQPLTILVAKP